MLAAKLKLNSPNAHTFLEIIGARWGTAAHLIFLFFGLATNMCVRRSFIRFQTDASPLQYRIFHVNSWRVRNSDRPHRDEHYCRMFPHPYRRRYLRRGWWNACDALVRLYAHYRVVRYHLDFHLHRLCDLAEDWEPGQDARVAC